MCGRRGHCVSSGSVGGQDGNIDYICAVYIAYLSYLLMCVIMLILQPLSITSFILFVEERCEE